MSQSIDKFKLNIIFFDGHCNLCNWFVSYILTFDHLKLFHFAPLSGETALQFNIQQGNNPTNQTVVLMMGNGERFEKSTAAILILSKIHMAGSLFKVLLLIPLPIRDQLYSWIAKNRYALFGKKDTCRLPTEEESVRFLP